MITFTTPVTVTGRLVTGQDSDGNDVYSDTTATIGGVFDPGGSSERLAGGDTVITQPTVYLPLPAPKAVDTVTVLGRVYQIDGDVAVWPPNPFTGGVSPFPVVARLKAVTG